MRLWREGGMWRLRVRHAQHTSTYYTRSIADITRYIRAS